MKWVQFKTVNSTNSIAKKFIENNLITSFTTISSDIQFKGKGTKNRNWYSSDYEGVYMTCVIKDIDTKNFKPKKVVIDIAKEVIKLLNYLTNISAYMDYPNDIMVNKKKLGGILMELKSSYLIVGIGLNINQINFPTELKSIATSLRLENNKKYDKRNIIKSIANKINHYFC
ncbi:MAG: biotin--[acetyl-CoA-carboxylase] ligase [Rickettsiales bacterium]|nr:biotin--[acetyl-CoA-carboxylase] ligase [Rickettsiales bacterium]